MTDPTKPLGMSDFFALEAGEYLERLDGALAQTDVASADELVRLARALRGSALMANQAAIARAAAGLEALARAVREGRRAWDAATKQLAVRAVDDLKVLVRRAATWTDADTAKAAALGAELEQLAGRPSGGVRSGEALGLDAGARAFVAREGAAIASALDGAAHESPRPRSAAARAPRSPAAARPRRAERPAASPRSAGRDRAHHRRARAARVQPARDRGRTVSDRRHGHRPRGAQGGRAGAAQSGRDGVPEVRRPRRPVHGERARRRRRHGTLLRRWRSARRAARRRRRAPRGARPPRAREP